MTVPQFRMGCKYWSGLFHKWNAGGCLVGGVGQGRAWFTGARQEHERSGASQSLLTHATVPC